MPSATKPLTKLNNDIARVVGDSSDDSDDWVTEEELEEVHARSKGSRGKGRKTTPSRKVKCKEEILAIRGVKLGPNNKRRSSREDAQEAEMFIKLMSAMLEAQEKERGSRGSPSTESDPSRGFPRGADDYLPWDDSFMMEDPFDDYDPFEDDDMMYDGGEDDDDDSGASPRDLVNWPTMWSVLANSLSIHGSSVDASIDGLLIKGELAMQTYNYSMALSCSAAAQYLIAASGLGSEATLIRANAIEMISAYQLGSRSAAVKIRDQLMEGFPGDSIKEAGMMSEYLFKRFAGTCEVLEMMPQLMGLLKQAREEKKASKRGGKGKIVEVE
ncbi:asparagine-linked glycosylation protein [Perkinsus chesapeaki]|uniref:Asparagine-linked glycosylation protein n=1 Tax=Perkinsus chesapeaki TaxID=330153 RepID=A0A7J6MBI5_PERCH|nr:asparagine-linked glycosylation protein [Perkinsus chesapeaki]